MVPRPHARVRHDPGGLPVINRGLPDADLGDAGPRQSPTRLPPGIASVLSVLSSSAVVLDNHDRVLRASAAARSFGLVKGDQLMMGELLALARQVRRDGEIREGEIEVSGSAFGGRRTSFAVRVAPLGAALGGGGLILLLAEDQTESRRVEEVRRDFVANISHELKTHRSARSRCSPRPWKRRPTTRRRCAGSPAGCGRRRPGSPIWSRT